MNWKARDDDGRVGFVFAARILGGFGAGSSATNAICLPFGAQYEVTDSFFDVCDLARFAAGSRHEPDLRVVFGAPIRQKGDRLAVTPPLRMPFAGMRRMSQLQWFASAPADPPQVTHGRVTIEVTASPCRRLHRRGARTRVAHILQQVVVSDFEGRLSAELLRHIQPAPRPPRSVRSMRIRLPLEHRARIAQIFERLIAFSLRVVVIACARRLDHAVDPAHEIVRVVDRGGRRTSASIHTGLVVAYG